MNNVTEHDTSVNVSRVLDLQLGEFLSFAFVSKATGVEVSRRHLKQIHGAVEVLFDNSTHSARHRVQSDEVINDRLWIERTVRELFRQEGFERLFIKGAFAGHGKEGIQLLAHLLRKFKLSHFLPSHLQESSDELSADAQEVLKYIQRPTE